MRHAVFLDRDGVINRAVVRNGKPHPPADLSELEILPGVAAALARLQAAGYLLIVVTNQPDVARGTTPRRTVDAIHEALLASLPLICSRAFTMTPIAATAMSRSRGCCSGPAIFDNIELAGSFMVGIAGATPRRGRNGLQDRIYRSSLDEPHGSRRVSFAPRSMKPQLGFKNNAGRRPMSTDQLKRFADGARSCRLLEMYRIRSSRLTRIRH